jgi:cell division protein FtsB
MNTSTLALLIPIVAIVGAYIVSIMKIRERQRLASQEQSKENQALHQELTALRKRIEVLEQLVTDDSYELKRAINKG